jgi:maltooligosyltrehalose trehalohydrolase
VREYFIHNALYWLKEYGIDGLRLDAVHAIDDSSERHFLTELAERVREGPGRRRHVHLVLENDAKEAGYLRGPYDAQWNDDLHHALHVVLTGESAGYYADYADEPLTHLGKALAEGFVYGEETGADLPPGAFVSFVQNHDQVGNRAFRERIGQLAPPGGVRAAAELYLLAPQTPMLFMGEEWNAASPFPFFCDFGHDLAPLVAKGRREEFAGFFDQEDTDSILDPGASTKANWTGRVWGNRSTQSTWNSTAGCSRFGGRRSCRGSATSPVASQRTRRWAIRACTCDGSWATAPCSRSWPTWDRSRWMT